MPEAKKVGDSKSFLVLYLSGAPFSSTTQPPAFCKIQAPAIQTTQQYSNPFKCLFSDIATARGHWT
jgi:hypothetical protein